MKAEVRINLMQSLIFFKKVEDHEILYPDFS